MSKSAELRRLLRQNTMLVVPGAFECISARMVEQAGFPAVYMTGAGTAATLGFPDYGLITMTEMVANAGRMANVLTVPLIADADTGYGNELNVIRTIREYEKHGVSGVHIEDQGFPKRCGHLDDKEIVPLDDFLAKIRAAASAKTDADRQQILKDLQKALEDKRKQILDPIADQEKNVIADVARKKGLLLVIDRADLVYGGTDITSDVTNALK